MKSKNNLTLKQEKFTDEYLIDFNATAACIRAGYSPNTANKIGSQLLGKTRVQKEIRRKMDKLAEKTGITAEKVLRELEAIAFSRATDAMKAIDNGDYNHPSLAAIKTIKSKEKRNGDLELQVVIDGKIKALELLGRHLGIFDKKEKSKEVDRERNLERIMGAIKRVKESHLKLAEESQ